LQVRAAVDLYRPAAQSRDLRISTDGPESLTVLADPDWLAQVLANLLNNAVAYTPDGGAISASWQERPDDVLIALSNTGEGIPAADIAHVFERFYRVEKSRDRQRGGAGIGLAIVRQLVESLGGRVGAESRDGLTRFWFTLPRPRGA
jgi:signal transduction histidine kinase